MNRDKKVLYSISVFVFVALSLLFLIPIKKTNVLRFLLAILMIASLVITNFFVKRKLVKSIHSRQVLLLMSVTGLIYVMLHYLMGLHFGFYKSSIPFSFNSFTGYILPISVTIYTSSLLFERLLDQKDKVVDVFAFLILLVSDMLMFSNLENINSFNRFMDAVGLTLIPSVTKTLLFMYITRHYGTKPIIAFSLITVLYQYILPIEPSTPDALIALGKMIVPLIVYAFIEMLYAKKPKKAVKEKSKLSYLSWVLLFAIVVGSTMLISNKFRYCMIVIATNSMQGELSRGDALIYETLDKQIVEEGQIIVFKKEGRVIVHRVVDIVNIDSQVRYYTKGDANKENDEGFIIKNDIVGIGLFKIPYIGYPTIWINETFNN